MANVLLDTHIWAWTLTGDKRLTETLQAQITSADFVFVSAISVYEIRQKVRLGKWPDMEPFANELAGLIEAQGAQPLNVTPEIAEIAAGIDWGHRDPFDRFLAASAIAFGTKLVSVDGAFDSLVDWPGRAG